MQRSRGRKVGADGSRPVIGQLRGFAGGKSIGACVSVSAAVDSRKEDVISAKVTVSVSKGPVKGLCWICCLTGLIESQHLKLYFSFPLVETVVPPCKPLVAVAQVEQHLEAITPSCAGMALLYLS